MKYLLVLFSLSLVVAMPLSARLQSKKILKPVAHIGSAALAAPVGVSGKEFIGQGLEELAAWAEGRPAKSAARREFEQRKENLDLLKDLLGQDGLTEYLLHQQPCELVYPSYPACQPYAYVPYVYAPVCARYAPVYYQPVCYPVMMF